MATLEQIQKKSALFTAFFKMPSYQNSYIQRDAQEIASLYQQLSVSDRQAFDSYVEQNLIDNQAQDFSDTFEAENIALILLASLVGGLTPLYFTKFFDAEMLTKWVFTLIGAATSGFCAAQNVSRPNHHGAAYLMIRSFINMEKCALNEAKEEGQKQHRL